MKPAIPLLCPAPPVNGDPKARGWRSSQPDRDRRPGRRPLRHPAGFLVNAKRGIMQRNIRFRLATVPGWIVAWLLVLLLCASPFLLLGWFWEVGREEVSRVTSPDGLVDAVLVRVNAGAMSSDVYQLYIVPRGVKPREDIRYANFVATGLREERLTWVKPYLLEIGYDRAHILYFANLWHDETVWDKQYYAELRLAPKSSSYSYLHLEHGGCWR